jgi:2-methylcitrate dehydratase
MDPTSAVICRYAADSRTRPTPVHVLHEAKRRLVDSLGCAVAAMDSPPARIARDLARDTTGRLAATAIGLAQPTTVELSTFANTVMVRYLDCNDTYFTKRGGGGHPSDVIPTALAVGQAVGASGSEVLRAIVLGYEINGALASAVWLRERGWDQGLNVVAATAMMAGSLLGLGSEELAHALALAVTPHVPVRQTRIGQLSMWKGCATAGAARNGIFAALLAARGMTGPMEPYEGRSGIWEQVTGPFEMVLPVAPDRFVIEDSQTKTRPAEYNAQAAIDLVLQLRESVDVDDIEAIDVETYFLAFHEIGSDPAKWDPRTRETADHSLPYLIAVAMVDGFIDQESCAPSRVTDPSLRPLMNKITIRERPDFTERFPTEFNVAITVRLRGGENLVRATSYPKGHPRNPVTDLEIDAKFDRMVTGRSDRDRETCRQLREALWRLDEAKDVNDVLEPLGGLTATDAPVGHPPAPVPAEERRV